MPYLRAEAAGMFNVLLEPSCLALLGGEIPSDWKQAEKLGGRKLVE